jgi:hypothetical protein
VSTSAGPLERAFREEVEIGAVLGVSSDPIQLDAFRDEKGKLPSNVFQLARKPGAGRTPGAKNKRSPVLAKLICNQSGDPVLFMASLYSMPLDQLVELIKIAAPGSGKAPPGDLAIRALAVQIQAAKEVAQYVHSKKPVDVTLKTKTDAVIIIPGVNAPLDITQQALQDHINANGLESIDFENMKLIEPLLADVEDGEGSDDV